MTTQDDVFQTGEDEVDRGYPVLEQVAKKIRREATHAVYQIMYKIAGPMPVGLATVAKNDLHNGDHIIIPRPMSSPENIPEAVAHTSRYFHHGIVIKDSDTSEMYVIGYNSPQRWRKVSDGETDSSESDCDEADGVFTSFVEQARRYLLKGVLVVSNKLLLARQTSAFRIIEEDLGTFAVPCSDAESEQRFIRLELHMCDNYPCNAPADGDHSAKVAKFFVQNEAHSKSFGLYSLPSWNCESFASFCTSTTLDPADLERQLILLEDDKERKEYLSENSSMTSDGLNTYLGEGFKALFMVPTYDCDGCIHPSESSEPDLGQAFDLGYASAAESSLESLAVDKRFSASMSSFENSVDFS